MQRELGRHVPHVAHLGVRQGQHLGNRVLRPLHPVGGTDGRNLVVQSLSLCGGQCLGRRSVRQRVHHVRLRQFAVHKSLQHTSLVGRKRTCRTGRIQVVNHRGFRSRPGINALPTRIVRTGNLRHVLQHVNLLRVLHDHRHALVIVLRRIRLRIHKVRLRRHQRTSVERSLPARLEVHRKGRHALRTVARVHGGRHDAVFRNRHDAVPGNVSGQGHSAAIHGLSCRGFQHGLDYAVIQAVVGHHACARVGQREPQLQGTAQRALRSQLVVSHGRALHGLVTRRRDRVIPGGEHFPLARNRVHELHFRHLLRGRELEHQPRARRSLARELRAHQRVRPLLERKLRARRCRTRKVRVLRRSRSRRAVAVIRVSPVNVNGTRVHRTRRQRVRGHRSLVTPGSQQRVTLPVSRHVIVLHRAKRHLRRKRLVRRAAAHVDEALRRIQRPRTVLGRLPRHRARAPVEARREVGLHRACRADLVDAVRLERVLQRDARRRVSHRRLLLREQQHVDNLVLLLPLQLSHRRARLDATHRRGNLNRITQRALEHVNALLRDRGLGLAERPRVAILQREGVSHL